LLTIERIGSFLQEAGFWAPLLFMMIYTAGVCLFIPKIIKALKRR
jgi:uncharacterized membrane protein YdjX (TVP38/TMEM64 family)